MQARCISCLAATHEPYKMFHATAESLTPYTRRKIIYNCSIACSNINMGTSTWTICYASKIGPRWFILSGHIIFLSCLAAENAYL